MQSLKDFVNRRFKGNEPWEIALKTAITCGFIYKASVLYEEVQEKGISEVALEMAKSTPFISGIIEAEVKKNKGKVESMALTSKEVLEYPVTKALPQKGANPEDLMKQFEKWAEIETKKYQEHHVSGTVYHGDVNVAKFLGDVYRLFALANPLHPATFPFVQKMESEVVAMTLAMFQGNSKDHCGLTTSGGTESILMAMRAYAERGKERGIKKPEIVACVTVHAAFDKAADYFGLKLVHVPCTPNTFALDVKKAEKCINRNTVVVVCSAPSYPQGIIDPVAPTAAMLKRIRKTKGYDIGLHVDSCLGGFLAPFVRDIAQFKNRLPAFDFSVDGVTSISADTHKYGYAPKGTSVLMYSSRDLRRYQYFTAPTWTGGVYATPNTAGSRPGGLIAAAWAAMMYFGKEGYNEASIAIINTADIIKKGIEEIKGIEVMGSPLLSVVGIRSNDPEINIYAVSAAMGHDGGHKWELNTLQNPPSIHICCTYCHKGLGPKFVKDLAEAVKDVRENKEVWAKNSSVAVYGTTQSVPSSLVGEISTAYMDALFKVPEPESKQKASGSK
eukprot:CAMPEP_0167753174 /NCGR_PEP_ID=MMETSP0110_2-20121227/7559_1 /TAXON_ID=629695 /ORGANISM="Gymnochlora sp., Strain CCMP2014" /LENGTH=557 /DNA_ID=CAMNT_0007638895 /DNA_START=65 /DNA_END=1738 /DNA_ORIENTATION=+